MGTLKTLLASVALAFAVPADAQSIADWRPYIVEASDRFGVPTAWIERVIHAESRGRTHHNGRPIRSSAGATGLMQLMPGTWADMRARLRLGANPDDPRDNILAGTLYLRLMYDRFGYPGLFAAYNAGPGRYAEHLAGRRALPAETIRLSRQRRAVVAGDERRGGHQAGGAVANLRGAARCYHAHRRWFFISGVVAVRCAVAGELRRCRASSRGRKLVSIDPA